MSWNNVHKLKTKDVFLTRSLRQPATSEQHYYCICNQTRFEVAVCSQHQRCFVVAYRLTAVARLLWRCVLYFSGSFV